MILPNLNHLKYFADSVELGSVSAAAQKNSVSHPAVSRAIRALEDQLGLKLLVHKKKTFEVTAKGFQIAQKAKELLAAADSFGSGNATTTGTSVSGMVSLGLSRTLGLAYLEPILKKLADRFPEVKLNVRFGTTGDIAEKLVQGSVGMALTIGHQPMATLKQSLMKRGEFVLVAPKKHKISLRDLSSEHFILTEPRAETEFFKKNFYRKYKSQPSVKYEVASWDMITHLVAGGIGLGLVPDIAIAAHEQNKIIPIKADWFQCPYEIYLNQSKESQSNSACRALVSIIEEVVKSR